MEWNRSETIALAKLSCTLCQGNGLRTTEVRGETSPCNCVLRAIFRACHNRFRMCAEKEKHMTRVNIESCGRGKDGKRSWGRRDEEYMADFFLVSKRHLDETEFKLFRFHFLLGADWKLCCRQLKMDRGTFFHAVYRIQQKMGRIFRELEPYALFPLDEYFGGSITKSLPDGYLKMEPIEEPLQGRKTLRPPVRKLA